MKSVPARKTNSMPAVIIARCCACHFLFVYDAGRDIGADRPKALAFIALEFFERRDLFLVSRESGMSLS
jgi:hypothetical protein